MRNTKPYIAVVIAILLLIVPDLLGRATDDPIQEEVQLTPEEQKAKEEEERQQEMQRVYDLPVQSNQLNNWPAGPAVYGEAAIVMDVTSGAILYAKNIDEQHYPASITKLLTTLVALEKGDLDRQITISEESVSFLEWDYAQIGLKAGEQITLRQALYATLLKSANEAAYAVAEHAGSGYDQFIADMNAKAAELGAFNSHFVNANGLHDDEHYTTARDMALISAALGEYPEVFEIMQTPYYEIAATNVDENAKSMEQNHPLLNPEWDTYYQYAIGGKTGYTGQAQNTLVTFAEKEGTRLVCVEMKTLSGKISEDTKLMLDYGFANFHKVDINQQENDAKGETIAAGSYVMLPTGVDFTALERETIESQDATWAVYSYEGQIVGRAVMEPSEEQVEQVVEEESDKKEVEEPKSAPKEEPVLSDGQKLMVGGIIITALCTAIIMVFLYTRKRRAKRKRGHERL